MKLAGERPILRALLDSCGVKPQQNTMCDGRVEKDPRFKSLRSLARRTTRAVGNGNIGRIGEPNP